MKKIVSILTALSLTAMPVAQRAYAQETNSQVQQNVEESTASKAWNTIKEYVGTAASAVAENKEVILCVTGASLLVGVGSFATYNGLKMKDFIKNIWNAEGLAMAQKVQLIAKVLFLRKEITAAELANLKSQNIINESNAIIKDNEAIIKSTDKKLEKIENAQKTINTEKATQEANKHKAMCKKKAACDEYNKAQKTLGKDLNGDKTCQLGDEYKTLDCSKKEAEPKVEEPENNGNVTDSKVDEPKKLEEQKKLEEPNNNGNGTNSDKK